MARKKAASAPETGVAVVMPEVDAFTAKLAREGGEVVAFCESLVISKEADRVFASNAMAEIAANHDTADAKRLSWVAPLKKVAADIDATFRPGLRALKQAEALLKSKIGAWDVAQAQARAALLTASVEAARNGNAAAAEQTYEQAAAFVPATTGASSKIVWTGEVLDAAAIPREYLMPDVTKLEKVTAAHGADPGIPGWRAFATAAVRTSRKGVLL